MKQRFFVVTFLLLLFALSASADKLYITTLPAKTYAGYYVGPAGGTYQGEALDLVCDDFTARTIIPTSFEVYISTIPALEHAKFRTQSNAVLKYQQAAWLMDQMYLFPAQVGPIQFAIWNIFYPATPDPTGSSDWLATAQAQNLTGYDFNSVRIFTPVDLSRNQEFLTRVPVPEPAGCGAAAACLLLVFAVCRRRRA